ncbi:hypothetical protein OIV83_006479 [Microbotryomycetes sp. JL201]|nr:hypothetical protein OIV83_006479 [Microbotryomycetes sp. JL201]
MAAPSSVPNSPSTKVVSFADVPQPSPPPADSPTTTTSSGNATDRPTIKRRRSSLKQGSQMPQLPPKEYYSHADPLLRRLRLRDAHGQPVSLNNTFKDTKLVLFLFGQVAVHNLIRTLLTSNRASSSTWPGASPEPYKLVHDFARRHPHQCQVVYVSVDPDRESFERQVSGKPWLTMEWDDGSNSPSSTGRVSDQSEPFLLAGDADLEEDTSVSDTSGTLYLRPYSRVFLAEKYMVLGVPSLMVYHTGKRQMLTTHARFELLREDRAESTWEKWEKGERITFSVRDLLWSLRWTLSVGAVATAYVTAVRWGGAPTSFI